MVMVQVLIFSGPSEQADAPRQRAASIKEANGVTRTVQTLIGLHKDIGVLLSV